MVERWYIANHHLGTRLGDHGVMLRQFSRDKNQTDGRGLSRVVAPFGMLQSMADRHYQTAIGHVPEGQTDGLRLTA